MKYAIIVYSSITFAGTLKKEAEKRLLGCSVIQTPKILGVNGCSYSLRCKIENAKQIIEISRKFGFSDKGIFIEAVNESTQSKEYTRYDLS